MKNPSLEPKAFPKWLLILWLVALLSVPLILWSLPADHFDEGQSMCPSVLLFDTECPGCGSTRAIQHLHHGELSDALYFHRLSPIIYIVLVGFWLLWTYQTTARLGLFGAARKEKVTTQLKNATAQSMASKAKNRAAREENS